MSFFEAGCINALNFTTSKCNLCFKGNKSCNSNSLGGLFLRRQGWIQHQQPQLEWRAKKIRKTRLWLVKNECRFVVWLMLSFIPSPNSLANFYVRIPHDCDTENIHLWAFFTKFLWLHTGGLHLTKLENWPQRPSTSLPPSAMHYEGVTHQWGWHINGGGTLMGVAH